MLKNASLIAKIGVDAAEKMPKNAEKCLRAGLAGRTALEQLAEAANAAPAARF